MHSRTMSFFSLNMLPDTYSALLLLLALSRSHGDSVTQTNGLVTITEGFPVLLNCTYQTIYSDPYLWWYVQYTNRAPQLLLRSTTDNKRTEHQGFHATLHKSNSSFHLQKFSVQLSDSALYYCALRDTVLRKIEEGNRYPGAGVTGSCEPLDMTAGKGNKGFWKDKGPYLLNYPSGVKGQQVKQSPVSLVLQEEESMQSCSATFPVLNSMQWFYQSPGGHLITLSFWSKSK
ncbi:T cell receptor alpha chain MC.7.G5-like [Alexandromys fortis]|uniref:T cell receptor alpha chain MC.7.G5-like n=1 Tax=Alexandromys fortis TaxID=100897 RepID=UPI0021535754|nr:T cell receptor alpha chain MC.7.G5-like [Microtus fortis]